MTTFTDDFNRADSTNLGANWVEVSGDWSIISNQLSSGNAGGTVILRAAGAMATSDHSAQVTISTTAAVSHGVWARGNTTITQGYLWRNDGTSWNLFSVVGGSFTSIGSFAGAAANGDIAKIQAAGSTIKGLVNGIERVSVTNTAVTTGTSVGLRAESTNLLRFDDFTATDVTSGATGDAALAAIATLSATGTRATSSGAALTPTATLTATGLRTTAGNAALATTASLTASGIRATSGNTALAAVANLTADGTRTTSTGAALATTATLTAGGAVTTSGDAALAVTASLTAAGQRTTSSDASLAATAVLSAQGQVARNAAAGLAGTVTFTADGSIGAAPVSGDAALNAAATFTAAGVRTTSASAGLTATATLAASGTIQSTHDDVDITVGAPYSPWTVGPPHGDPWPISTPQGSDWEVAAPW